jgi:hypothetical protein
VVLVESCCCEFCKLIKRGEEEAEIIDWDDIEREDEKLLVSCWSESVGVVFLIDKLEEGGVSDGVVEGVAFSC